MTEPTRAAPAEPDRLLQDRELGALLERGNRAYRTGLDEATAFRRLSERIDGTSKPRSGRFAIGALSFGALGLGAAFAVIAAVAVTRGALKGTESVAVGPDVIASRLEPDEPAEGGPAPVSRQSVVARYVRDIAGARWAKVRELGDDRSPEAAARGAALPALGQGIVEVGGVEDGVGNATAGRVGDDVKPVVEAPRTQPEAGKAAASVSTKKPPAPKHSTQPAGSGGKVPRVGEGAPRADGSRRATPRSDCFELARRGDLQAAEHCFRLAALDDYRSFDAEANRFRGMSLEAMGNLPAAIAAYRRYLASAPSSPLRAQVSRRVELLVARVSATRASTDRASADREPPVAAPRAVPR